MFGQDNLHLRLRLMAVLLLGVLYVGCANETSHDEHGEHGEHEENAGHDEHDDMHVTGDGAPHDHPTLSHVELTPEMMQRASIEVRPVRQEPLTTSFTAPATVSARAGGLARVGTIVPGRVADVHVNEGSWVKKGAPLAQIESPEVGHSQAEYHAARAAEQRARQALTRQKRLDAEGIGAGRRLEEAQAEYDQAVAARRAAEAHLRSLGVSPSSGNYSNRMTIRAPITGMVSSRNVTLGEYVEADDDMFTLMEIGTVWINARVPAVRAAQLQVGGTGFARSSSGERVSGKIIFISPLVDEETKTVTARIEAPNRGGEFRPGTMATAEFEQSISGMALTVPLDALERDGGNHYVYLERETGHFDRIEIDVASQTDDRAVVNAGLVHGDKVATAGVFYLRSIRQKGELSEHQH